MRMSSGQGRYLGSPRPSCEDAHDVEADVEADEVGEGERAHGVGHAELEDLVDGLGRGDAFHHGEDGLVDQGHEDAVGDEAGASLTSTGVLPSASARAVTVAKVACEVAGRG